ncbi:MAG: class I SAM-dependent methyltransferase [Firmicutes bacterium]|nr:class I SAM-dependent methyltransferase [Bacillota bacterium]
MYFLSSEEITKWQELGNKIVSEDMPPENFDAGIKPFLKPVFLCYAGVKLFMNNKSELGIKWLREGALDEQEGLFFNAFLSGFIERQNGKLIMPAVAFEDPAPYIHFAGVPAMETARVNFLDHCAKSLPVFKKPFSILDIGTGDGGLLIRLLRHLRNAGNISEIEEIGIVDASKAMCDMAKEKIAAEFPDIPINAVHSKIQDFSEIISRKYDVAMSSLAYHHMPMDDKIRHMKTLEPHIDHFLLFEIEANHETPEMDSPELITSIYQNYGRMVDYVFSHDAPVDIVVKCVDCFLMTEVASFLIQPRGVRTDYHMLRTQWYKVFSEGLGNNFKCICDCNANSDQYLNLFTLHYARG